MKCRCPFGAAAGAEVAIALGKAETTPNVLLPFAYEMLTPPSPEELNQAASLLAHWRGGFHLQYPGAVFGLAHRCWAPMRRATRQWQVLEGESWNAGKMLEDGEHGTAAKASAAVFAGRAHELAGDQSKR